jgi:3-phenylpropionate/trans-cinnamate dioxygenase ferredoxin reductase subunit
MRGVVIVGAGHAGVQAAASLRESGYEGKITLLDRQPGIPYQRPPLSKEFMKGEAEAPPPLRPPVYFERKEIELRSGEDGRVVELDAAGHRVRVAADGWIAYDQLILATGAKGRALPVPGVDLDGVFELRSHADAEALRARLDAARSVVIVGGGFIGMEFAACARQLGKDVIVIEALDRLMARSATATTAEFIRSAHEEAGTEVWLSSAVAGIEPVPAGGLRVTVADGRTVGADLVLIGVGVVPEVGLLEESGVDASNGAEVDAELRTGLESVFAIGDCAVAPLADGRRLRLESVQSATAHARAVARVIAGAERGRQEVPWFWSDQLGIRLQIAGLCGGADRELVKGDPGSGSFSVLCFEGARLVGAETINDPRGHVAVRKILESGVQVGADKLADPDVDLAGLALAMSKLPTS